MGQSTTKDTISERPIIDKIENLDLRKDGAYINGKIQGVELPFLVDSRSSVTIISPRIFDQIPHTNRPTLETGSTVAMTTASSDTLEYIGKGTFTVEVDNKQVEHTVWVSKIDGNGILGYDFLSHHDCCLDLARGELHFNELPFSPYSDDEFTSARCCRIAANQDLILPPESEVLIPARVVDLSGSSSCGLVEPTYEFDEKYEDVLMAKSVVNTKAENIVIRVLNPSEDVQRIYKNMIIATCEPIEESEIISLDENMNQNENVHCNLIKSDQPIKSDTKTEELPEYLKELYEESSEGLDNNQKSQLRKLLLKHQSIFAKNKHDLGYSEIVQHKIDVGNAKRIKQAPRRLPIHQREIERKQVREMLEHGIIEEANSPWASNCVLVKK